MPSRSSPRESSIHVKRDIEDALTRRWNSDADNVQVAVQDGQVTLSGTVANWWDKEVVQQTAWNARGITLGSKQPHGLLLTSVVATDRRMRTSVTMMPIGMACVRSASVTRQIAADFTTGAPANSSTSRVSS